MSKENKAGEYSIYKIYWDDNDDVYVGHSMDMETRKEKHKNNFVCKPSPTRLLHQAFERNGVDNRKYEILETKWCDSEEDACKLEKVWWKRLESNLNMYSPYQTKEEKKKQIQETGKRHYEVNKDEINHRRRERYQQNKEGSQRQARERYHRNKDKINRKRREKRRKKREEARSLPSSQNP